MTVRILTVCTGNVCRSPYAELTLAHQLEQVRPGAFEVTSAGTGALVNHPVDPGSARLLDASGVDHSAFAARQLSEQLLQPIDLVLAMAVEHRKLVLSYAPRLLKRCYTIKETARLIDSAEQRRPWAERLVECTTPDERWARIPMELARERGLSRVDEGVDDVADPFRRPDEAFEAMASDIDAAVACIVALEAAA